MVRGLGTPYLSLMRLSWCEASLTVISSPYRILPPFFLLLFSVNSSSSSHRTDSRCHSPIFFLLHYVWTLLPLFLYLSLWPFPVVFFFSHLPLTLPLFPFYYVWVLPSLPLTRLLPHCLPSVILFHSVCFSHSLTFLLSFFFILC